MPGGCPQQPSGEVAGADVDRLPPVSSETIRVLIAEDEALIRLDLKEMLEEEGYSVVAEVGDGSRPSTAAKELDPDLVILDIQMPVLDGLSAAEQIASARIAPVIVLTAFSQRELVERARDAGAMAYLVKPFSKNDLVPAIEVARARFSEMTALDGEVRTLEERLETRKVVEKAKGRLMEGAGHHRGRGVPLDPADGDEPADLDEGARAVDPRARRRRQGTSAEAESTDRRRSDDFRSRFRIFGEAVEVTTSSSVSVEYGGSSLCGSYVSPHRSCSGSGAHPRRLKHGTMNWEFVYAHRHHRPRDRRLRCCSARCHRCGGGSDDNSGSGSAVAAPKKPSTSTAPTATWATRWVNSSRTRARSPA